VNSGFISNHKLFGGYGWIPHPILNGYFFYLLIILGDRTLTEYRLRYNPHKPIHRDTRLYKSRKLP